MLFQQVLYLPKVRAFPPREEDDAHLADKFLSILRIKGHQEKVSEETRSLLALLT
jgi:hypothetical protein